MNFGNATRFMAYTNYSNEIHFVYLRISAMHSLYKIARINLAHHDSDLLGLGFVDYK